NLQAWARTGYENGPLRYPTTDEGALPDGRGIAQWFQGGAVYWSPATGSHALTGALLQAWIGRGAENGPLGYPLTDTYAVTGGTRIDFQGGTLTLDTATGTVR
ncbi:LGFP repeat-containing protein, partial [Modestobacter sp. SYSU DS0290]